MKNILLYTLLFLISVSCKEDKGISKKLPPKEVIVFENPSSENSQLPRLFSNGEELYFSWITKRDSLDVLSYSVLKDSAWSTPNEIISGDNWFTNWADFPVIAEVNGNILTSFLPKSAKDTYTYDVRLNLYNAKTNAWKKNFILHNDGTKSEHGFVSMRPYVGDSFFITWLDGRETVGKGHGEGQMTLRGAIVFEDGTIDYDTLLDDKVCDCCGTSSAIGPNDELLVVYRDRSDDEIRDVAITRWDKKNGWNNPQIIGNDNWKIAGCPVNGPSIDADGSSIVVGWFTAGSGEGEVNVAFSKDVGATFSLPTRVDAGNATGRVEVVMLSDTDAAVLWMEPSGDNELLQLVKVSVEGEKSEPITVAITSSERASGFPQIEKVGDELYFAWTLTEGDVPEIEMAKFKVLDL